jgi:YYY domain-containing protein
MLLGVIILSGAMFASGQASAQASGASTASPPSLIYGSPWGVDAPLAQSSELSSHSPAKSKNRNYLSTLARQQEESLQLDEPVSALPVVDDARWSSAVSDNTWIALIFWIVLLAVLFVTGLPIAILALGPLADRGLGFARLIGLLLSGFLLWTTTSYGLTHFRVAWCAFAIVVVYALGLLLLRLNDARAPRIASGDRSVIAGSELAFWASFAFFLTLRFLNPDSWHPNWGGEKPMEFAHFNSILRSAEFPPHDPWFAGGILNYYYYGEYLIAFTFKLTGIPSEIAFNLAQPTVMALVASGAFSISASIGRQITRSMSHNVIFGAVGIVMVLVIGNLTTARLVLESLPNRPTIDFSSVTWAGSRAISGGITEFPYFTGLYADLHAHVIALPITFLVIALCLVLATDKDDDGNDSAVNRSTALTVGVRLLLAAIAVGTLGAANAWDVPVYALLVGAALWLWCGRFRSIGVRIGVTTVVGSLLAGLAYLSFWPFHRRFEALYSSIDWVPSGTAPNEFLVHLGGLTAIVFVGMLLLSSSGHIKVVQGTGPWLVIGGTTLLIVAGAVSVLQFGQTADRFNLVEAIAVGCLGLITFVVLTENISGRAALLLAAIWTIIPMFIAGLGWTVFAIALTFVAAGSLLFALGVDRVTRFLGLFVIAAFGVVGGVERIFVVDDLASLPDWFRMNTVFKFYNQVWILVALTASTSVALFFRDTKTHSRSASFPTTSASEQIEPSETPAAYVTKGSKESAAFSSRTLAWLGLAVSVVVIGASLLYPTFATKPRLDLRFAGHPPPTTLNGLDWMRYGQIQMANGAIVSFNDDLEIIEWFNNEVPGTPVIAEASIGPYRGNGSRISIATGLPSVLGWDRHERQQRPNVGIDQRFADLRVLFGSPDPQVKQAIIERYQIDYIVVGELERNAVLNSNGLVQYASPAGLAVLQEMVGEALEEAFRSGTSVVYRVV